MIYDLKALVKSRGQEEVQTSYKRMPTRPTEDDKAVFLDEVLEGLPDFIGRVDIIVVERLE